MRWKRRSILRTKTTQNLHVIQMHEVHEINILKILKALGQSYLSDGSTLKDKRWESLGSSSQDLGCEILTDWWGAQREKGKEENRHWAGWQTLRGVEWICESPAPNRSGSHVNSWKRAQGDKSKIRSNRGRRRKRWTRREEEHHQRENSNSLEAAVTVQRGRGEQKQNRGLQTFQWHK